jgi:hypothetical protein
VGFLETASARKRARLVVTGSFGGGDFHLEARFEFFDLQELVLIDHVSNFLLIYFDFFEAFVFRPKHGAHHSCRSGIGKKNFVR